MKDSLGVGPSKGNQGTTRGKEKILLISVGIKPTTSGIDLPLLCRLSYEVGLLCPGLNVVTNFSEKLKAEKANTEGITSLPNLKEFHRRKFEKSDKDFSIFSPQKQSRHQNGNSSRSLCGHARIFEPHGFVDERPDNSGLIKIHTRPFRPNRFLYVFF